MQSISEDPLEKCPECGAPTRRVLHSPAIHFKGSGFHNTDYGTRSRNRAKESGESGESGESSSSSSGSGSSNGDGGKSGADSKGSKSGSSKDSSSSSD